MRRVTATTVPVQDASMNRHATDGRGLQTRSDGHWHGQPQAVRDWLTLLCTCASNS
jgi:hypothetical protein